MSEVFSGIVRMLTSMAIVPIAWHACGGSFCLFDVARNCRGKSAADFVDNQMPTSLREMLSSGGQTSKQSEPSLPQPDLKEV